MKRKITPLITILIALFIFTLVIICMFAVKASYQSIMEVVKIIPGIATCIVAAFNLYLAQEVFQKNSDDKKKDSKSTIVKYWYRELVLEKNLPDVKLFFEMCVKLIDELENIHNNKGKLTVTEFECAIKDTVIAKYTQEYTSINRKFITDLRVINVQFSQNISNEFANYQDFFTRIVTSGVDNWDSMKNDIYRYKSDILRMLFEFDLSELPT